MTILIGKNVYIAETAVLIGDVTLSDGVSVFDHAVLRGDLNEIFIGENSNVQDNVTVHVEKNHDTHVGENVSIGHNAVVHGAYVEKNVIVGMSSVLLNGSRIGQGSVVAAGAVVTENFNCPGNSILAGVPAKILKTDPAIGEYPVRNGISYQKLRDVYIEGNIERKTGRESQECRHA